ncbi:MAG: hypothetical protein A3A83_02110 [Candidatus Doudnabacteria bacterium RIFCSPLOWO2_01_FULL_48_57]|nr:MAG: hypothetical protein A3A83_02110 [Candidatus Doudnabacteria bacterium RIFCSPLOWO2_01_FULL_48_57]
MNQGTTKIKYFLYARKSSESEDRQIQSIDDQIKRLKELAVNQGLNIKKIYTESKSAKQPENRPVFAEVLARIEKGEADGILCWQINRLSRNPIDSGKLSWLLQQGVLKSIQTHERQYLPEDNVLLFSVESGMANQFLVELRTNTIRGMIGKLEKGGWPSLAPAGYVNDKLNHTVIKDPDRFHIIRKVWDLMLTGSYSISQILDILNNQWGFRTLKRKQRGGTPLAKSGLYAIFTDLFYTGLMVAKGKYYQGKHEPMITSEEYDRVQTLLKKRGNPRPRTTVMPYRGFIKCGECGCMITGYIAKKFIRSTKQNRFYNYYCCTRKKVDIACSQKKAIKENDLELQIENEIEKITILPEFRKIALDILHRANDEEVEKRSKVYESQHRTLEDIQKQLGELTGMRVRGMLTDEEYMAEKEELQKQQIILKQHTVHTEARVDRWLELTEQTFDFATYAGAKFIHGDIQTKKEIAMALGQNFILKDGKLAYNLHEWFVPIKNDYPKLKAEYLASKPEKKVLSKQKSGKNSDTFSSWGG